MTVVAAVELDNQVATGSGAGDPECAHRRLGAAVDEPETFDRRHARADQLPKPDLGRAGRPERAAGLDGGPDRLDDRGVSVAQHEWTESADVIDVAVAVRVPDERPLAPHHDRRFAAD